MIKNGHIKDVTEDENGYRQFVVNCLGSNDRRKYFSIAPFGVDFNAPDDTRGLTADSTNRDESYSLGVLNKVKIDDLNKGESAIFSTLEDGSEIKSKVVFRNSGDIEINKELGDNASIIIGIDGTIQLNGSDDTLVGFTELKSGFDKLASDLNSFISSYNSHIHITTATVAATPAPGVIAPTVSVGTPTVASIDASEKENLLSE